MRSRQDSFSWNATPSRSRLKGKIVGRTVTQVLEIQISWVIDSVSSSQLWLSLYVEDWLMVLIELVAVR
ncbi:hypothetical protein SUGI_0105200 [Cryptomeria japonica]|nr:hypothetical protein SUGI_0105200 [Cryptomeria japonica]